jgi:hypothetical protein
VTVRAPLQQDAGTTPAASAAGCGEEPANAAGEITVQALRESFPQWRIFWQVGCCATFGVSVVASLGMSVCAS